MHDENQNAPGAVIQPGTPPEDSVAPSETQPAASAPQQPAGPQPDSLPAAPEKTSSLPTEAPSDPETAPNWQYRDDEQPDAPSSPTAQITPVSWTASEFIEHSKSPGWYAALAGITILLAGLIFLLTKDKISTGVVVIVAITFGILANHKPRELPYVVDDAGVHIGDKTYPYENFKSFAVVQENAIESIWLMPLKRFMPILTIYFDPNDEKGITDVLSAFLPLENHELDPVDRLMHKIRF